MGIGVVVLLNMLFAVFAFVSLWRCAPNTNYRVFEAGTRGLVILLAAIVLGELVQGAEMASRMMQVQRVNHLNCAAPTSP